MSKVLFVNLTKLCNVNCPRCYLTPESRESKVRLQVEDLNAVIQSNFFQAAKEQAVIFQGGEPTIVGHSRLVEYASAVEKALPSSRLSMVSNLLNMPDWLLEFSKFNLAGRLETTYAAGHKFTLAGSSDEYQRRFEASLLKATKAGIKVPINVELNSETVAKGPGYLVDVAKRTGASIWEFDFSVDFEAFQLMPLFNRFGYPILKKTITYEQFYRFIIEFKDIYSERIGEGLQCGVIDQFLKGDKSINFNIQRETDFVTLNPDGTVTTNPLFSDIVQTYIGNVRSSSLDHMMGSSLRLQRIIHEKDRVVDCLGCDFYEKCGGGVSHLPVLDKSSECVGGKKVWSKFQ
ncbi:hypothetical protein RYA05_04985 [Pseudomonas syringae pv. actinidiae]|nr:hypothetical protein [Pseudomonas syringae pv. actinidiae]